MGRGRGLAEVGHHVGGEEFERFGVGIIGAPGDETGAAEVDLALDLLAHLLGGAHQVGLTPALERLAPQVA